MTQIEINEKRIEDAKQHLADAGSLLLEIIIDNERNKGNLPKRYLDELNESASNIRRLKNEIY